MQTDYLEFLRAHNAGLTPHSGRTLLDHLSETYALLKSWGCSEAVATAGLFHSIYGTNAFAHNTLSFEQREVLRALIGAEAEYLAWIFCSIDRPDVLVASERRQLKNRYDGSWINITSDTLRDLITIECANLIEQHDGRGFLSRLMSQPETGRLGLPVSLKIAVNQYLQSLVPVGRMLKQKKGDETPSMLANGISIIRPARASDVIELVYLAREMHADSRWQWTFFDKARVAQRITQLLEAKDASIVVAQRHTGIIGFGVVRIEPLLFTSNTVARLSYLYVQHRYRGMTGLRLLRQVRTWAKSKGACELRLEDHFGVLIERNSKLFERLGMTHVGNTQSIWL